MTCKTITLLLAMTAATFAGAADSAISPDAVRYDNYRVVDVTLNTPADIETMLRISPDFWACGLGTGVQRWTVAPDKMPELENSGLNFTILHENFQKFLDDSRAAAQAARGGGWYDAYRTLDEINDRIDEIVAARPDLVEKFYIGDSIQGRPVYGMTIMGPGDPNRPALLFNGCQHAREWISPMTMMYIAEELTLAYDDDPLVQQILGEVKFYIIPVVNPDGYEYSWTSDRMWRKNRRYNGGGIYGVDLNRNWSVGWGGAGSSGSWDSLTYRGTAPFSEPESSHLRDFINAHNDLVFHIDFHSYSQLILSPYGYDYVVPPEPDKTFYETTGAELASVIYDVFGEVYVDKPAHDLYLASGICTDWVHEDGGVHSLTIELRPNASYFYGFELPPDGIDINGAEIFEAAKFLALDLAEPLAITFSGFRPETIVAGRDTAITVRITDGTDELDPNTPSLFYRTGDSGPFSELSMTPLSEDRYQAVLPQAACGDQLQFYVRAQTTGGAVVASPSSAPSSTYVIDVANELFFDDMETDLGWTVGAPDDDASAGVWNRMDPEGTAFHGQQIQPTDDASENGTVCWITDGVSGQYAYENDVDGGKTTLTSPVLDLSDTLDPIVSFRLWYYNNEVLTSPDDVMIVDVSNDGGGSWVNALTLGPDGLLTDGKWFEHRFRVADFVTPSDAVMIRFVASDYGDDSYLEAGVDDFLVLDSYCPGPPCLGDLDGDGSRDLSDLAVLLDNYPTASGASYDQGDLDFDGDIDLSDLAILLDVYGDPCP